MWFFINYEEWQYLTYFLTFLLSILLTGCTRSKSRRIVEKSNEDQPQELSDDPNYDETQENAQTVQMKEDHLSNVRLLAPTLGGSCNDENAAKEAANRHKTNEYFPKLEIQNKRIVNDTPPEELKRLLDELPPHPPQRFRTEIKEPSVEERKTKWKDVHVNWHETGIVFLVRSQDTCRSKDDAGADTVDTHRVEDEKAEDSKMNSEMPLSETKNEKTPRRKRSKERTTPAPSSRKSQKERKLAKTQEDSNETKTVNATAAASTVKRNEAMKQSESVKSVNL